MRDGLLTLFVDIDGVFNGHEYIVEGEPQLGICRVRPECVEAWNAAWSALSREWQLRAILCSAWRDLIHAGHMSCEGFAIMLRSHGAIISIAGTTPPGHHVYRPDQIRSVVADQQLDRWLVIDDLDFGDQFAGRHYRPNARTGLRLDCVDRIYSMAAVM